MHIITSNTLAWLWELWIGNRKKNTEANESISSQNLVSFNNILYLLTSFCKVQEKRRNKDRNVHWESRQSLAITDNSFSITSMIFLFWLKLNVCKRCVISAVALAVEVVASLWLEVLLGVRVVGEDEPGLLDDAGHPLLVLAPVLLWWIIQKIRNQQGCKTWGTTIAFLFNPYFVLTRYQSAKCHSFFKWTEQSKNENLYFLAPTQWKWKQPILLSCEAAHLTNAAHWANVFILQIVPKQCL